MELWEGRRWGPDSYADPDYASIYGLGPPHRHRRALRRLPRNGPPVVDIVEAFEQVYGGQPMLYVVQVQQTIEPAPLAELRQRFDRSDLRIYDINIEGMKHRYPARHEAVANLCPGVPGPAMSLAGTGKREQTSMPYRFIRTLCLDKSTGDYAASIGNQP